jgi:hypothetical protein
VSHAAGCDARGDTFDYRFTTAVAVPDALNKILAPSRAQHFWLGDTVSIDARRVARRADHTADRSRDRAGFDAGQFDHARRAVVVEYVDESTWRPAQVQYPPDSDTVKSVNAEAKRVDGIVNRDQAFRECAFYYQQ